MNLLLAIFVIEIQLSISDINVLIVKIMICAKNVTKNLTIIRIIL